MQTLQKKFYEAWYKLADDQKNVIVFPPLDHFTMLSDIRNLIGEGDWEEYGLEISNTVHIRPTKILVQRTAERKRVFSALDMTILRLCKDEAIDIMFSRKKILTVSELEEKDLLDAEKIQACISERSKNFQGLKLLIACRPVYRTYTNKEGEKCKRLQKIIGKIS